MHSRNPYDKPIDFAKLASAYSPLSSYIQPRFDFKDEDAQRTLTRAILKVDYALDVELPEDRLCPPVPNRLNYVLWIQDLVSATRESLVLLKGQEGTEDRVLGLDVGTGASAIYPLLACSLEPGWDMYATEIDERSLSYARANVERNALELRIRVVRASSTRIFGPLFPHSPDHAPFSDNNENHVDNDDRETWDERTFDFTMCNPPFYSSLTEISSLRSAKETGPLSSCTGSSNEMIYAPTHQDGTKNPYAEEGGEVAFVARMVEESVGLGTRCRWYTSMLGKMGSVPKIIGMLKERGITNYGLTEFVQGQTRRWGIAWSFGAWRLPDSIARIRKLTAGHALAKVQPARMLLEYEWGGGASASAKEVVERVLGDMGVVDVHVIAGAGSRDGAAKGGVGEDDDDSEEELVYTAVVRVCHNTWSRAARRARARALAPQPHLRLPHGGSSRKRKKATAPTANLDAHAEPEDGRDGAGETKRRKRVVSPSEGEGDGTTPERKCEHEEERAEEREGVVKMVCIIHVGVGSSMLGDLSNGSVKEFVEGDQTEDGRRWKVGVRWVYGDDREMFEGFSSHLARKVGVGLREGAGKGVDVDER